MIHTGLIKLLGNEPSEQKVDNTGCPHDSSELWGMFLLCCVSLLPCSRSKTFLVISLKCSVTAHKACNNYLWSRCCPMFLSSQQIKWEKTNYDKNTKLSVKQKQGGFGVLKSSKVPFGEQADNTAKSHRGNTICGERSLFQWQPGETDGWRILPL